MKSLVYIFLLVVLVFSNVSIVFVFASFKFNKDYIVENYCINKNRPQLKCDGKCYLRKQVEQSHPEEQKEQQYKPLLVWFNDWVKVIPFLEQKSRIGQPILVEIEAHYSYLDWISRLPHHKPWKPPIFSFFI